MSFFVVGARAKTMPFNKSQKKKSSGDRSGEYDSHPDPSQIHHIQFISEGIFDARSDAR